MDDHRLATELRCKGFFYHRSDAGLLTQMTDEEILEKTDGSYFRAGVEFDLAVADLWQEIKKVFEYHGTRVLRFMTRSINWIRGNE